MGAWVVLEMCGDMPRPNLQSKQALVRTSALARARLPAPRIPLSGYGCGGSIGESDQHHHASNVDVGSKLIIAVDV